jgi:hypothetical protein
MYLIPLSSGFSSGAYEFDFKIVVGKYFGLLLVGAGVGNRE